MYELGSNMCGCMFFVINTLFRISTRHWEMFEEICIVTPNDIPYFFFLFVNKTMSRLVSNSYPLVFIRTFLSSKVNLEQYFNKYNMTIQYSSFNLIWSYDKRTCLIHFPSTQRADKNTLKGEGEDVWFK